MCSAARGQGTKLALWLPAQGPPSPTAAFTGPAPEPHSAAASWCSEQARLGSLRRKAAVRPGHHGSGSVPSHPGSARRWSVSAPQGSTGREPRTSPLHLLAMAATPGPQAWLRGGAALTLVLASSRLLLSFSTHRGSAGDALGRSTGGVSLWAGRQSPRLGGQGRLPAWPDLNWDQCAGPGCNLTTPPWPRDPHPGHSASQAPDRSQVTRAWCQQGTVAPRRKPGSPASASDCRSGQRGAAQCPPLFLANPLQGAASGGAWCSSQPLQERAVPGV